MLDFHLPMADALTDKVVACVYVLCLGMMFGVAGQCFRTLVIDVQRDGFTGSKVQLREDVSEPKRFLACV